MKNLCTGTSTPHRQSSGSPLRVLQQRVPTTSMRPCALLRRARLTTTANSTLTTRTLVSCLRLRAHPRMHGEFLRLLFLQAHGALHRPRNASATTLRFFSLPPRGVLQWLEEQSGSGCGKAAALRVNLNINGCSIVAPPARSSRSSCACLTDSVLSHSLPMPHVH